MLKNIDPVLSPDLLKVLAEMGHGDEIAVVDANFTATSLAAGKPLIHLPGLGVQRVCQAVLSLLPLDAAVTQPVAFMAVGGQPDSYRSALQRDVIEALASSGLARPEQCEPMERFGFYDRVRRCHAVVQTGELQPWANFLFKKGVIAEALRP